MKKQFGIFYQRQNQNGKIKWEREGVRFEELKKAEKWLEKNKKDKYFNYKIMVREISEWENVENEEKIQEPNIPNPYFKDELLEEIE